MMRKTFISLLALSLAAANACSRQEPEEAPVPDGAYSYVFSLSGCDTRAVLGDESVEYEDGDKLGVFAGPTANSPSSVDLTTSPVSVRVTTSHPLTAGETVYAYYPYSDLNASGHPSEVQLSIPVAQRQDGTSFDADAMPMVSMPYEVMSDVAAEESQMTGSFLMCNLGAVVEFGIYGGDDPQEKIRSVRFLSQTPICGDFAFDLTSVSDRSGLEVSCLEGTEVVTEISSDMYVGSGPESATKVYMVIAPGEHKGVVEVETSAATYSFAVESAVAFNRSSVRPLILNLAKAQRVPAGLPEEMKISLSFTGETWPFEESCIAKASQRAGGEKYTFTYDYADSDPSASIELPFVISRGRYRYSTQSNYVFAKPSNIDNKVLIFSADSSWIKLPAIEGRRLKSVSIYHDNTYSERRFRVQDDISSTPDYIRYSNAVKAETYGTPVEMKVELDDTRAGWPYVVKFTEKGGVRVFRIELVYTEAWPEARKKTRVGIMGDSISTFVGELFDVEYRPWYPIVGNDRNIGVEGREEFVLDRREETWWGGLVYEYMDNAVIDANSSYGGSKVISQPRTGYVSASTDYMWDAGMADRVYDFNTPDIIFIHGGTNDSTLDTPLGDYEWDLPISEMDVFKFRSAYVSMVRRLLDYYKDVQLILIIGDSLKKDYEESIIAIAGHYGLPYVNFVGMDVEKCDKDNYAHPSAAGHGFMARHIYDSCREYLR